MRQVSIALVLTLSILNVYGAPLKASPTSTDSNPGPGNPSQLQGQDTPKQQAEGHSNRHSKKREILDQISQAIPLESEDTTSPYYKKRAQILKKEDKARKRQQEALNQYDQDPDKEYYSHRKKMRNGL